MGYEDIVRSLRVNKFLEVQANMSLPYQTFTATGTPTANVGTGIITLNHASTPILLTIPAPEDSGQLLIIRDISSSTQEHVITSASGTTFDGTNNTATFNASGEQLILMSVSITEWIIILNSGSVAMSLVA